MTAPIAIIGAAGQTGRPIVAHLRQRGVRVRAVVHRPGAGFPVAIDEVVAALASPGSLELALRGARAAYYIPPALSEREVEFARHVMDAADAADLPRLVYHSVMHPQTPSMPHHWRKWRAEETLRASDLAWTIVQPDMCAQSVLAFLNRRRTMLPRLRPRPTLHLIDLDDLGEAVAALLLDDTHVGRTYELAGAELLTTHEMGEQMSRAWQHPVRLVRLPAVLVAAVGSLRFGRRPFSQIKAMLDHYNAHGFTGDAASLTRLLRRAPRRFSGR